MRSARTRRHSIGFFQSVLSLDRLTRCCRCASSDLIRCEPARAAAASVCVDASRAILSPSLPLPATRHLPFNYFLASTRFPLLVITSDFILDPKIVPRGRRNGFRKNGKERNGMRAFSLSPRHFSPRSRCVLSVNRERTIKNDGAEIVGR